MEAVGGVGPRFAVIPAGAGCTGTVRRHSGGLGLPPNKTPGGEPGVFICLGELLSMRKDGFPCGINSP